MRLKLLVIFLILSVAIYAQSFQSINSVNSTSDKENLDISTDLFYTEDFSGAIRMYKKMILFDPKNPLFYYNLGFAYLNTFGKQDSAIIYLNTALKLYKKKPVEGLSEEKIKFYLARSYRLKGNLDSAIILLEDLMQNTDNEGFIKILKRELKLTEYSLDNLFAVKNIGQIINSQYSEHSPVFLPQERILLFTSRRPAESNAQIYDDDNFDENIYLLKGVLPLPMKRGRT